MRITDLVFGPRYRNGLIRPTTIDLDTVREIAALCQTRFNDLPLDHRGPATVTYQAGGIANIHSGRTVAGDSLDTLSSHDRNTLIVSVVRSPAQVHLSFLQDSRYALSSQVSLDGSQQVAESLRNEINEKILNDGTAIWRPHLLTYLLPLFVGAVFISLWAWLLCTIELPIPAAILGWMVSLGVIAAAVWSSRKVWWSSQQKAVRHRIRDESRAKTYARRADEKRDAKVLIATAIVALPSGFFLAILTNAFGLTT